MVGNFRTQIRLGFELWAAEPRGGFRVRLHKTGESNLETAAAG